MRNLILVAAAGAAVLLLGAAASAQGQWGRRAPLPDANSEIAVAASGGKFYVIGGYPATRVTVATVQVYDAAGDRWVLIAPLPLPVNHAMAAAVAGKVYLFGGQTSAGGRGQRPAFLNTVFEFDPARGTWRRRAPMPTARGAGAAAVVDGKIYVVGGRPPRGSDFAVYDPAGDSWTSLPDLPGQRNHLGAVAIGGRIHVMGGRLGPGFMHPMSADHNIYDPATRRWTRGAPLPRPRGGVNAVAARGCIHVFGGEGIAGDFRGVFPDHDVYDPRTNAWRSLAAMPVPVHGVTGAAFIAGLIHLPGGGTRIGGSSGSTLHQTYRPTMACE